MPLINSPRHSSADLAAWERFERLAVAHSRLAIFRRHVERARATIHAFAAGGCCYAGTSWGKDSVVVADLIAELGQRVPLIWITIGAATNPDCPSVRDSFLRRAPSIAYEEINAPCPHDDHDELVPTGRLEAGFEIAAARFGPRHMSGVRGEESGTRALRMRRWGESSQNTCAPIGWWSGLDVFAYLITRELPIHPAYACTMGGLLDPTRIRVASLGGSRGDGMGRREWEERYYGRELAAFEAASKK